MEGFDPEGLDLEGFDLFENAPNDPDEMQVPPAEVPQHVEVIPDDASSTDAESGSESESDAS